MGAPFFQFKQFTIYQDWCSMKVTTDACLFAAWVAHNIKNEHSIENILDIGSGTGLLSLMLAQQSSATIDGIELQEKDRLQSLENVTASPWKERINIIHADAAQHQFNKKYDVIISNPPFYENDLKSDDAAKNLAHHDSGLNLKSLADIISENLQPGGKFFLLLPERRKEDLIKTVENKNLFINEIVFVRQTEKHQYFRIMAAGSFAYNELSTTKIIIKENGSYSRDFQNLLFPYYLNI